MEADGAELRRLISAWCDGVIDAADLRRLEATLTASDAARRMFIALMHIHSRMQGQTIAQEYLATFMPFPLKIAEPFGLPPLEQPPSFLQMVRQKAVQLYRRPWTWAAIFLIGIIGWSVANWSAGMMANRTKGQQVVAKAHLPSLIANAVQPRTVLARRVRSFRRLPMVFRSRE